MADLRRETIQLSTADGPMSVYSVDGTSADRKEGCVLLMDAGGVRDALREIADRFAQPGRHVLVPELLHRQVPFAPFDMKTAFSDPKERERILGLARTINADSVARDLQPCMDHLAAAGHLPKEGVRLVGYCLGGRYAFLMAARFPDRVAAAASIHGGSLVTAAPDSPHLSAPRAKARLYFGVSAEDPTCTPENVATLRAALAAAGARFEIENYAARHGFAVRDTAIYDAAAAERHFQAVEVLFGAA
jgi:carboxymethylenebutenolidase